MTPRRVAISPSSWSVADDRVDGRALHAEQAGERFLGQLDAVAGAVLRGQQPARGARLDRVEGVAGDRLHHLRQQIIGKAAEQVADEAPSAAWRPRARFIGTRSAGPGDQHLGVGEGRRVAAADDAADRAFAADRGDFDGAAVGQLDAQRDHRRAEREIGWLTTCSPRARTIVAGSRSTTVAVGLDQRARLGREGRQQAVAGERLRRSASSSSITATAIDSPPTALATLAAGELTMRGRLPPLDFNQSATASTLWRRPTSRQSATSRSGATSTWLRRSSISSTKRR